MSCPSPSELKALRDRNERDFLDLFDLAYERLDIPGSADTQPSDTEDPSLVAACLRAVSGRLDVLGIRLEPRATRHSSYENTYHDRHRRLSQLLEILRHPTAPTDDLLTIFEAAAMCFRGPGQPRSMELVEIVLDQPHWRDEAIARCPDLFRDAQIGGAPHLNALYVFAKRGNSLSDAAIAQRDGRAPVPDSPAAVARTLEALDRAGVRPLKGAFGQTPAFLACGSGMRVIIEGFIAYHGRSVLDTERNEEGETVLHLAASRTWRSHHLDLLLDLGADPLALNHDGQSPLAYAVEARHFGAVRRLLATRAYGPHHIEPLLSRAGEAEIGGLLRSHLAHLAMEPEGLPAKSIRPL